MKTRIKELRKKLRLTQQSFADTLGMKQNTIASYEIGRIEPSDPTIKHICKEFNVNETWLRTGEGEMFTLRTRREAVQDFVDHLDVLPDDDFKVRLISTLAELDEKYWVMLADIAKKLSGQKEERWERESRLLQEEADAVKKDGEKCSASPRTKEA